MVLPSVTSFTNSTSASVSTIRFTPIEGMPKKWFATRLCVSKFTTATLDWLKYRFAEEKGYLRIHPRK